MPLLPGVVLALLSVCLLRDCCHTMLFRARKSLCCSTSASFIMPAMIAANSGDGALRGHLFGSQSAHGLDFLILMLGGGVESGPGPEHLTKVAAFRAKAAQKFLRCWAMGCVSDNAMAQTNKVFLLLFVHKK
jgi:hypothetical protein